MPKRLISQHPLRFVLPYQRPVSVVVLLFCLLALNACLLISGERTTTDRQGDSGNLSSEFVSAEGQSERTLKVADGAVTVQVIAILAVESGDLRLDILQPDGAVVFSIESQPDEQVTRSSQVQTDAQGEIRYRVIARGARNGNYQLLFQGQ